MADAKRKGRAKGFSRPGSRNPAAVLTEEQAQEICRAWEDTDITMHELAREHGLSPTSIHHLVRGLTWKHLERSGKTRPEGPQAGVHHHWTKVRPETIEDIRRLAKSGTSQTEIARRLSVRQEYVSKVLSGKLRRKG